ncbi:MAG: hypothetical protein U0223_12880 [Nitrospira sp.]
MPSNRSKQTSRASQDKYDPYCGLDPLFDRLEEILQPLRKFPDRARIPDFDSVREQELLKGMHWREIVIPVIQDVSKQARVKASEIELILLQWWHPSELGVIKQLAAAMGKGKQAVKREIRLREKIISAVAQLGYPPLPTSISSALNTNCALAFDALNIELSCYRNAEGLLHEAARGTLNSRNEKRRGDSGKPRAGTRTAVLALRRLFARNVKSKRRQSILIYTLLSAWNATLAPPKADSIRTGYR